ncbi:MAG: hypothetical protein JWN63_172 [Candidatus Acidoferrum typicum]|nr:hypothetical protein [Candidatus Acidoferrum typicum]
MVEFEERDSFCEGERRELSPRGAALTRKSPKHPAKSCVHQNGHALGDWLGDAPV